MNKSDMLRMLHNEEKVFLVEINNLYTMLDVKLGLHGADVPITFNYDERALGAYIPPSYNDEEHFEFSLLFIGFCLNKQISAEDRINLYKHEYAHYMTRLIPIPDKYKWQPGIHGSAWKYCCSLIGAVPAEYYAEDQKLKVIDYDAELTPKKVDH
nr:hypothetical protein [Pseudobutyrivibrio sp.]